MLRPLPDSQIPVGQSTRGKTAHLQKLNPKLPVLGVEIDPARVASAQPFAGPLIQLRQGDFALPLRPDADGHRERVRLIHAFNVLRQYEAAAVPQVLAALRRYLLPGGLLIEGTIGSLWTGMGSQAQPGSASTLLRERPAAGGARLCAEHPPQVSVQRVFALQVPTSMKKTSEVIGEPAVCTTSEV